MLCPVCFSPRSRPLVHAAERALFSCGARRGLLGSSAAQDASRNSVVLTESKQAAAVDEVQWLAAGELVAVGTIARRRDHDSLGSTLMLNRSPQVAHVGGLDRPVIQLGLHK